MSGKGKCFNCEKPGHFSKDCNQTPGKLKNKFNMLKINDKEQEELFRILKSNNLWKMIFLLHLILVTNLLMILLILLILKLAIEIPVVMLLTLLILSLKAKKMKN